MIALNWLSKTTADPATRIENRARIVRLTVGVGDGTECDYCHKEILPEAVQYEVDAVLLGGERTIRFHRLCHHLWESM
jgi:hypothetical protein